MGYTGVWFFFCIYTSLTSQSALPTEAVGARTAIKGPAPATKTKPIHLRPQRDRMQATYSNPKPTHKNSRKNESIQEPHWAFWSAPPLNYSEKPPQHLWRQVILYGRVSCCGWIVSSFTLSLSSCTNWHCFIVLLGQSVVLGSTRREDLLHTQVMLVVTVESAEGWPPNHFPYPQGFDLTMLPCLRIDH